MLITTHTPMAIFHVKVKSNAQEITQVRPADTKKPIAKINKSNAVTLNASIHLRISHRRSSMLGDLSLSPTAGDQIIGFNRLAVVVDHTD